MFFKQTRLVLKDYKSLNFDNDKMETLEISSFDDIRLDFS